jgi:hypothetical protein
MTTVNRRYVSRVFTGTTTAAYAEAAVFYEGMGAVFVIRNTHATLTLKYKVDLYLAPDTATETALANVITSETTLNASTTASLNTSVNYPYYKVVVSVIDGSGHATYQIDARQY